MGKKRILQKKKKTKGGEKGRPNWFTWTAVLSWKAAQKKKRKEGGGEKEGKIEHHFANIGNIAQKGKRNKNK